MAFFLESKMNVAVKTNPEPLDKTLIQGKEPIVIIGSGPIGIRFLKECHDQALQHPIIVYGGEPWAPYNRVRLSSLLAGEVSHDDILLNTNFIENDPVVTRYNCKIVSIDRDLKQVVDEYGATQRYEKLILATGSNPFIPDIPGKSLEGVFKFRDLNDTEKLIARRTRSRKTVVLGGGLLGVEAARAMQRFSTDITVVEHCNHLLFRQLDAEGAELFQQQVETLGIKVYTNETINEINGDSSVSSIKLKSGKEIECDTLIISAGIVPNISLAKDAGLAYGRGIKVNDVMQTSDPDIYAIGECCEHRGEIYGVVAPGYEQATIAANHIISAPSHYNGTVLATSLKVAGLPVFSMGDIDESVKNYTSYTYQDDAIYRRINVYRGQILGVIAIGEWTELVKLKEFATKGKMLLPWQLWKFKKSGAIWGDDALEEVNSWPQETIICSCNGIVKGELTNAINNGCNTVNALAEKTGASTVCGSCKPLLASLVGNKQLNPVRAYKPLYYGSLLFFAMIIAAYFLPSIPYNNSVQISWRWDQIWTNSLYKQISGFTLLGISIIVLILSFRKRVSKFKWGDYDLWRLAHTLFGGLAIFVLLTHTGFRLGDNLNFLLMLSFTSLILVGSILAAVISMEHKLTASLVKQVRSMGLWLHILFFWPMPVLLGFHIFKTYYF